ncbi:MAG: nicotinamidase [Pseudomonadota bacterium]
MAEATLQSGDALIVVDVQNDFCPGGRLPVPDGDRIVPVLNRWITDARDRGCAVVASRDWHPKGHVSFREQGGDWPEHCVQDTDGAAFHPRLRLPEDVVKVSKGVRLDKDQYSAFDDTGLGDWLRRRDVHRLWVGGLAEDVCVRATVLSAREEGFDVRVVTDATRAIDAEKGRAAEAEMGRAGAELVSTPA